MRVGVNMTPDQLLLAQALRGKAPMMSPVNPYASSPFTPASPVDPRYGQAAQDFSGEEADIENQRLQALALQKQSMNRPDIIQAGNVAVAGASPFTALAQGISGWGAGRAYKKAEEASKTLSKTKAAQAQAAGELAQEAAAAKLAAAEAKAAMEERKIAAKEADTELDNIREDKKLLQKIAHDKETAAAALLRAQNTGKGKGTELTAAQRKEAADRNASQNVIDAASKNIDALDKQGKSSSGIKGIAVDLAPEVLKGPIENALYDKDERKQRAQNAYIDSQVKEAITTGVLSDQDVKRLLGLNVGSGGLTPEQQATRLDAISEIMGKYDMTLDVTGFANAPEASPDTPKSVEGGSNPAGVDQAIWDAMTPEEQALFQ